jgi:hypothetical protein
VCPVLTLHVEADLPLDVAVGVPDGVAALVRPRGGAQGHVAFVDDDTPLVAVPGQPRAGHQHQSRPAATRRGTLLQGGLWV